MTNFKSHKTVEQIAKKHGVDVSFIQKQLEMGEPIEHEHTKDHDLAKDIALQHLGEIPDYYTRLKKMEADAKKQSNVSEGLLDRLRNRKLVGKTASGAKVYMSTKKSKTSTVTYGGKTSDQIEKENQQKKIDALRKKKVEKGEYDDPWLKSSPAAERRVHYQQLKNEETKSGDEGLHDWFNKSKSSDGKSGWVQLGGKWAGKPCARQPGQTSTPKCGSSKMKRALSKDEEEAARRRKNRLDPNQPEKTGGAKPTNVRTEEMDLQEVKDKPGKGSGKKDACYHKVKSRYDVWPSAYASGALVKCRKVGADNWGTKSEDCWDGYKQEGMKKKGKKIVPNCVPVKEEQTMIRYCPKCQKDETRSECKYGPKYWDMFSIPSALTTNQLKYNIATVHPGNFPESYDHEYSMARSELSTIISAAKRLRKKMKGEGNIEAWVQSKITKAADYIDAAADYVDSGEMKTEEYSNWRADFGLSEDWQKVNRQDKTDGLSQKAVDAYRRENPGSKLQTAVTEKNPTGKRAGRRKNFCSRMKGMKSKLTSAKTARDPDSRINKALRRWNCN